MLGKFWKVGMTFTWFITEPTFTDIGYISCPTSSITPGRLKALVLRRDSDWYGACFGEVRLPQRFSFATSQ